MATIYVWNSGSNTSPYDTWAKAATTLNTGLQGWSTGNVVLVAKDHQEGTATVVISAAGSAAEPIPVYTADRADDSYAVGTTHNLNLTDAGADLKIQAATHMHIHGLDSFVDDNFTTDNLGYYKLTDCTFEVDNIGGIFELGSAASSGSVCECRSCTFATDVGGTLYFVLGGASAFYGCTFTCEANSAGLFRQISGTSTTADFIGCDFTGIGSSKTLADASFSASHPFMLRFINCDVPSDITVTDGGMGCEGDNIELISTDSGGNLYRYESHQYRGTITTQTGDLYRTNGYSDADGGTNASHKIVPSSTLEVATMLTCPMLTQYVSTTGSKTIEVHAADTFTTAPNKNQLYIEVFYLNAAGETLFTLADSRDANILATTALTTTTGEWTDSGTALTHEYKMSVTATVNQAGYIGARVVLEGDQTGETAKALYYDPKLEIS